MREFLFVTAKVFSNRQFDGREEEDDEARSMIHHFGGSDCDHQPQG